MSEPVHGNRLIQAYNRMMERLAEWEQEALGRGLERAVERAVELGELTREEARQVADFVKRDLQAAGRYMARGGRDLAGWLRFDLDLIEERLLDLFRSAADRTKLELLELQEDLEQSVHYRTGEITGPGTLRCEHCGRELQFHATAHIPPCPGCQGSQFERVREAEEEAGD
ncbi:MAG TPA: zinc ribbon-containing protein [Candidatus Competibacteraceae bacterium]|nr:zinc ribbon-containing protein [Candidatus Competibacteraceae bacterium]